MSHIRKHISGRYIRTLLAIIVFTYFALFSSCRIMFPSYLQVVSFSPDSDVVEDPGSISISIIFNAPVNTDSVQDAFSFFVDGTEKQGDFAWDSSRGFQFLPDEPINSGREFEIRLDNSCEDIYGISLKDNFEHSFRTSSDIVRPTVTGISPSDNQVTDLPDSDIVISFSEPMDWTSVLNGLSVSPAISYSYSINAATNTLTLSHSQDLNWQQEYFVSVSTAASDINGNTLGDDFSSRFFVGSDDIAPVLNIFSMGAEGSESATALVLSDSATTQINTGIETFWHAELQFSEQVSTDSLDSRIQVQPPLPFTIVDNGQPYLDTLILHFDKPFVHGTTYQIMLNEGYEDAQGNTGNEQYVYLQVDGIDSIPPEITYLALYTDTIPGYQEIYNRSTDTISPPDYSAFSGQKTHFAMYIRVSQIAAQDLGSLKWTIIDNWRITPANSCVTVDTILDAEVDPSSPPAIPYVPSSDEVLVLLYYNITNNADSGYIDYTMLGGFVDGLGIPIAEEWSIRVDE